MASLGRWLIRAVAPALKEKIRVIATNASIRTNMGNSTTGSSSTNGSANNNSRSIRRLRIGSAAAIAGGIGVAFAANYYSHAQHAYSHLPQSPFPVLISHPSFVVTRVDIGSDNDNKEHHVSGGGFRNPDASFRPNRDSFLVSFGRLMLFGDRMPPTPQPHELPRVRTIDWTQADLKVRAAAVVDAVSSTSALPIESGSIHLQMPAQSQSQSPASPVFALTWFGHAAFFLSTSAANILLDPCLSERCSPFSFAGPRRLILPPCEVSLLDIDVVVISHNHYDHLDIDVLKSLRAKNTNLLVFVPLGNKTLLLDAGFKASNIIECDWWDSYNLQSRHNPHCHLQISCTPSQHFSSRYLWDKNSTLWSSWHIQSTTTTTTAIASIDETENNSAASFDQTPAVLLKKSKSFFFGGDTGYRTVHTFAEEFDPSLPTCPAFRQVRARFGPVDIAALPIGAYSPRSLLSNVHCSPRDAVDIHRDLESRKSVAMHWGTFVLSREGVMEPPRILRDVCEKIGVEFGKEFVVVDVGETIVV